MKRLSHRNVWILTLAFGTVSVAQAVDFDYESTPLASYAGSLSVTNAGLTCTASSAGGWVHITNHDVPSQMGTRYVIANSSSSNNPPVSPFSPIDFTFSSIVSSATLLAGDTGGDNDGYVTVALYDGSNNYLQTYSTYLGTSALGVSINIATPFKRAVVDTTATSNPHSIGAEWRNVTAAPEPGTMAVLAGPLLALLRRKKRA